MGYEVLVGAEPFFHAGRLVIWVYSTNFWESVLIDLETYALAGWSATLPEGLADHRAVWRAVNRSINRRYSLYGGSTPLSRGGRDSADGAVGAGVSQKAEVPRLQSRCLKKARPRGRAAATAMVGSESQRRPSC